MNLHAKIIKVPILRTFVSYLLFVNKKFHPSFEGWNLVVSCSTRGIPPIGGTGRGLFSKMFVEHWNSSDSVVELL
jgi:hypothetical protein